MKVLIYTIMFIILLVPLVVGLGLLLKAISFLISSFISFKEKFSKKKDTEAFDTKNKKEEKTVSEMETIEVPEA